MKIIADYYKTSDNILGGVQSKSSLFNLIDPEFKNVSYADACAAISQPLVAFEQLRFREWEANWIIQRYVDLLEKCNPEDLDLVMYNSLCGGYMKHNTRTLSVVNDNYIEMPERLYAGAYLDNMGFNMYRRMYLKLQLDSFKNADLVVTESVTDAGMYKDLYGVESTVVENGVDSSFWSPLDKVECRKKYDIPLDKKVGIFVGAFTPIKGYHIMQNLVKAHKDVHWILVFKHPLDQNIKSKNVTAAVNVNPELMRELYSASDFFVLPSIWESGHSIATLEAMSCNLPLLVSNVGAYAKSRTGESMVGYNDFGYVAGEWNTSSFEVGLDSVLTQDFKPRDYLFKRGLDFESYKKRWVEVIKN